MCITGHQTIGQDGETEEVRGGGDAFRGRAAGGLWGEKLRVGGSELSHRSPWGAVKVLCPPPAEHTDNQDDLLIDNLPLMFALQIIHFQIFKLH